MGKLPVCRGEGGALMIDKPDLVEGCPVTESIACRPVMLPFHTSVNVAEHSQIPGAVLLLQIQACPCQALNLWKLLHEFNQPLSPCLGEMQPRGCDLSDANGSGVER
jgi:hypothetical protein